MNYKNEWHNNHDNNRGKWPHQNTNSSRFVSPTRCWIHFGNGHRSHLTVMLRLQLDQVSMWLWERNFTSKWNAIVSVWVGVVVTSDLTLTDRNVPQGHLGWMGRPLDDTFHNRNNSAIYKRQSSPTPVRSACNSVLSCPGWLIRNISVVEWVISVSGCFYRFSPPA